MRTTLTLDEDVAASLRQMQAARGMSFKEAVNTALREGLQQLDAPRARKVYHTRPSSLGRCLLPNVDDVSEVLAIAEGDAYR
jgi:hypothetical protein